MASTQVQIAGVSPMQSGDQPLLQTPGPARLMPPGGSPGATPPTPPSLFPPQGMPGIPPPRGPPQQPGMPPPVRLPPPGPRLPPPGPRLPPPGPRMPHHVHVPPGPQPLMRMPPPVRPPQGISLPPPSSQTEVWFEHKTADGRTYYSHPQTQKTTWERPQNAQIIPQLPPGGAPVPGGLPLPFPFPLPNMPGAPQLVPTKVWSEHTTPEGKTYYYNKVTRQSVWEKPKDFELVMPLPAGFGGGPPPQGLSPNGASPQGGLPQGVAPQGMPAQGIAPQGMPAQGIAPQGMLPHGMSAQRMPSQSAAGTPPGAQPLPQAVQQQQPPLAQVAAAPTAPSGPASQTSQTGSNATVEDEKKAEEAETMEVDQQQTEEKQETGVEPVPTTPVSDTKEEPPSATAVTTSAPFAVVSQEPPQLVQPIVQPILQPVLQPVLQPLPQPIKEEPKGPRPISSFPIPGTPWSVVWTSDERRFFFNVTSHTSVWTIPEELASNPQVVRLLDDPPGGKKRVGEVQVEPVAKRPRQDSDSEGEGEGEARPVEPTVLQDVVSGVPVVEVHTHLAEATDTEKKAVQLRAGKSLEERQRQFKEMLLERGVSAFSTWDKELPKFVFDPRYMLLNTKERKACFEAFIRSRAEEERKEKKSKLKEKKDQFRALLEESRLHPRSNFSDFAVKYGKEERFRAIEKMRDREQLFSEYLSELKKANKMKDEHHKQAAKSKAEKVKSDFLAMLSESDAITERTQWKKVKGLYEKDVRYKAVGGVAQREEWFQEHVKTLVSKSLDPDQERQERIQASLKEREREVKMSRTAQEKEWDRERDQLRKSEATQHFKALLVDMVRNSDAIWHDTKRSLRRDHRWELADLLETTEKERLFREHAETLAEKKRLQFRKLLEETPQITLTMPWKKARKLIKEDPRYKNFGDSDHRRELEYDKYLRDKMVVAKNEFRALLRETKKITYRSHELIRESGKHYREIVEFLKNDRRFLVLECVADEREAMLQDHIHDLYRKGPPPPPTATNPSDRLKKPL